MFAGPSTIVVYRSATFCTVFLRGSQLKCDCAKHTSSSCPFVTRVKAELEKDVLPDELCDVQTAIASERETTAIKQQVAASWKQVSFMASG